jgi:hypothetical protein
LLPASRRCNGQEPRLVHSHVPMIQRLGVAPHALLRPNNAKGQESCLVRSCVSTTQRPGVMRRALPRPDEAKARSCALSMQ